MSKFKQVIIVFLLTSISLSLFAQKIEVSYLLSKEDVKIQKIFSKTDFKDSLSLSIYLEERLPVCYEQGYLESSIDSIVWAEETKVYIYVGQIYNKIDVRFDQKYEGMLRQINSAYLSQAQVNTEFINRENNKIISFLENNAYPFSKVQLDSVQITDNGVSAFLVIDRGERILYDSVRVVGDFKISNSFLYGYTGVKPGLNYNSKKVENVKKLINDLPFAQQSEETKIIYKDKKVNIEIPAKHLSNNRFDGILGILPNDKTTGELVLTGEINIFLQNMLRSAEELKFKWQKLESSSQELDIDFKVPYIFNTRLGLSAGLNLHKQDSTYINSILQTGVQYYFHAQNSLGFQFKNKTSAILSKDTLVTSELKNYQLNAYGLTFNYKQLDYAFNPHKGIDLQIEANIGNKNIKNHSDNTTSVQYDGFYKLRYFVPVGKKHTILLANQSAFLLSKAMYINELYRIGGLNTLRGFMESSIYASSYTIATVEYRFIFERNSALFVFFDGAWYEKKFDEYHYDYPFGFGMGLFFKTKAGIFTISYTMGQQRNENLNIKNAKIHFGFINRF